MAIKTLFAYDTSDLSENWNNRFKDIFKKGIFSGGVVSAGNGLSIVISPFVLITPEGLVVREDDENQILAVDGNKTQVVGLRAKFSPIAPPTLQWIVAEQQYMGQVTDPSSIVWFASFTTTAGAVIPTSIKMWAPHRMDFIGRSTLRPSVQHFGDLPHDNVLDGDIAYVKEYTDPQHPANTFYRYNVLTDAWDLIGTIATEVAFIIDHYQGGAESGHHKTIHSVSDPATSQLVQEIKTLGHDAKSRWYSNVGMHRSGADASMTVGQAVATVPSAVFISQMDVGGVFKVTSGANAGTYKVDAVQSSHVVHLKNLDGTNVSWPSTLTTQSWTFTPPRNMVLATNCIYLPSTVADQWQIEDTSCPHPPSALFLQEGSLLYRIRNFNNPATDAVQWHNTINAGGVEWSVELKFDLKNGILDATTLAATLKSLVLYNGNLQMNRGNINMTHGSINMTEGNLTLSNGNIAVEGNLTFTKPTSLSVPTIDTDSPSSAMYIGTVNAQQSCIFIGTNWNYSSTVRIGHSDVTSTTFIASGFVKVCTEAGPAFIDIGAGDDVEDPIINIGSNCASDNAEIHIGGTSSGGGVTQISGGSVTGVEVQSDLALYGKFDMHSADGTTGADLWIGSRNSGYMRTNDIYFGRAGKTLFIKSSKTYCDRFDSENVGATLTFGGNAQDIVIGSTVNSRSNTVYANLLNTGNNYSVLTLRECNGTSGRYVLQAGKQSDAFPLPFRVTSDAAVNAKSLNLTEVLVAHGLNQSVPGGLGTAAIYAYGANATGGGSGSHYACKGIIIKGGDGSGSDNGAIATFSRGGDSGSTVSAGAGGYFAAGTASAYNLGAYGIEAHSSGCQPAVYGQGGSVTGNGATKPADGGYFLGGSGDALSGGNGVTAVGSGRGHGGVFNAGSAGGDGVQGYSQLGRGIVATRGGMKIISSFLEFTGTDSDPGYMGLGSSSYANRVWAVNTCKSWICIDMVAQTKKDGFNATCSAVGTTKMQVTFETAMSTDNYSISHSFFNANAGWTVQGVIEIVEKTASGFKFGLRMGDGSYFNMVSSAAGTLGVDFQVYGRITVAP